FRSCFMKRLVVHFVLTVCLAGLVSADQTIQSVQQALKEQRFYYGNVTGEKSAETTAAVRRYQIRKGLQVTGEIDAETVRSLHLDSRLVAPSETTSKPAVTQPKNVRPDENAWLGQNPAPESPGKVDRQFETNPDFSRAPYRVTPRQLKAHIVAEVEYQLGSRGYYRGRIDGRYGRRLAFAVRAFQLVAGLPTTGRLDAMTLNALGISDANLAYLEPAPRLSESHVPVAEFKHGKWKVKWKKVHRHPGDDFHEQQWESVDAGRHE
ncbi:MAG: peptidoglycan-binding domain-containing protein, partial [Chthoniobacterales bacterium]